MDIDGTIVDTTRGLFYPSEKTVYSVKELQKRGDYVILSSGRPRCLLDEAILQLHADGMILSNGAYVELFGSHIYKDHFNNCDLKKMSGFVVENDAMCLYEKQEGLLFQGNADLLSDFSRLWDMELMYEKRAPEERDEVYKLSVSFINENSSNSFIKAFKDDFDIRIQSNRIAYDIGPKHVSKGTAVKMVLKDLNINKKNTYAFGNGINDLEMLNNVGHPFSMKNAEPELLRKVKNVADDVLDDGVYKQLRSLSLIS